MQGFYIASSGSLLGSALAFATLRYLFSARLREWSEDNQKWQALEAVVVCPSHSPSSFHSSIPEGKRVATHHSHPPFSLSSLGLLNFPLCRMSQLYLLSSSDTNDITVHRTRSSVAICRSYILHLPENRLACLHWLPHGRPCRWRPAGSHGHSYGSFPYRCNFSSYLASQAQKFSIAFSLSVDLASLSYRDGIYLVHSWSLSRSHIPAQDYIQIRPATYSPLGRYIP